MFSFIQESAIPKLSQTSLFQKFNETSDIAKSVVTELGKAKEYRILPSDIPEIVSLMKLNGDQIARKALAEFESGKIIVLNNKTGSQVPIVLPYITVSKGETLVYVFAQNILNEISSNREYVNLMAALEAAYLARHLVETPDKYTSNAQLMLTMCAIYNWMVVAPLEQRVYMKGENLSKAQLYVIAYFYKMIRGDLFDPHGIPYKRIMLDKVSDTAAIEIFNEVGNMESNSFLDLIELITKINPVRYKDLKSMYLTHFISTCGSPIVFALENPGYLFMLITSAVYKTGITQYSLNKLENDYSKKAITLMTAMNI